MAMTKEQAFDWLEMVTKRDGYTEIRCHLNEFSIDGVYCDYGRTLLECVELAKAYDESDMAGTLTRTV